MKSWDPEGKLGPRHPLPDSVVLLEPKEEAPVNITSESRGPAAVAAPAAEESAPAPEAQFESPANPEGETAPTPQEGAEAAAGGW